MSEADKTFEPPAPGLWRESPIINNPYRMPELHLKLRGEQSKDNRYLVAEGRRVPGFTREDEDGNPVEGKLHEPYGMIGRIRGYVNDWRESGFQGVDANTARLLHHWTEVKDGRGLFFCQREAIETLIWLHIFKGKDSNCKEIHQLIDDWNEELNDGLPRLSTKMATGTGKTAVMAMLMLWMALRSKDPVNNFLVITPGITVTERLGDLKRKGGKDVFSEHELLPGDMHMPPMNIEIHHRHRLEPRSGIGNEVGGKKLDKTSAGILETHTNDLIERTGGVIENADESFQSVMDRLCGRHIEGTPLAIFNDEAHHCYAADGDAKNRKWYDAILRIRDETSFQIAAVHDFSATPIWIQKRPAGVFGDVFPWTVSDFPLIESVESGLTKIPRIPTNEDSEGQKQARSVFDAISKKAGTTKLQERVSDDVQAYLDMLVRHHLDKTKPRYEEAGHSPILCVVANTISNAQAFYRTIAGHWDEDPGKRELGVWREFSNVEKGPDGTIRIKKNPPTLLVHSEVDKGEGAEVGETGAVKSPDLLAFFGDGKNDKAKYKNLAERIRKMFSTAGRKGENGEHVRCIVSVSMLTEGWDCRTVTEIFGYRAFQSDLLIEQVTGRALRRTNYDLDDDTGLFRVQHANLVGIPFTWVPDDPNPGPEPEQIQPYECRVVEGRETLEIRMPRVERYEAVPQHIKRKLNPNRVAPHQVEVQSLADTIKVSFEGGLTEQLEVKQCSMSRDQAVWTVAAKATAMLIEREKESDDAVRERLPVMWDMVIAAREWWAHPDSMAKAVRIERAVGNDQVASKCADALLNSCEKIKCKGWMRAHLDQNHEWASSAEPRSFERRLKHRYPDKPNKNNEEKENMTKRSQRNVAPCHSKPEVQLAKVLDNSNMVDAWIRNEGLKFYIPYRGSNGYQKSFEPDFVARSKMGNMLVIEYKGEWKGKSEAHEDSKRRYTESYWIPAVNAMMEREKAGTHWGFLWLDRKCDLANDVDCALASLDEQSGCSRSAV